MTFGAQAQNRGHSKETPNFEYPQLLLLHEPLSISLLTGSLLENPKGASSASFSIVI